MPQVEIPATLNLGISPTTDPDEEIEMLCETYIQGALRALQQPQAKQSTLRLSLL